MTAVAVWIAIKILFTIGLAVAVICVLIFTKDGREMLKWIAGIGAALGIGALIFFGIGAVVVLILYKIIMNKYSNEFYEFLYKKIKPFLIDEKIVYKNNDIFTYDDKNRLVAKEKILNRIKEAGLLRDLFQKKIELFNFFTVNFANFNTFNATIFCNISYVVNFFFNIKFNIF